MPWLGWVGGLVWVGCQAAPVEPAVAPAPSPVAEEALTGPHITELKPSFSPGEDIELWLRPGPDVLFTPSPHRFERKTVLKASETPFGEGGIEASRILRAVLGDPPPESHLPLWAKSLELGVVKLSGGAIQVDDDPTAGLANYVGRTSEGRLVMLLELGP